MDLQVCAAGGKASRGQWSAGKTYSTHLALKS